MAQVQPVAFRVVKGGGAVRDYEDYYGYDPGDPETGEARCVVLDGASTAFDSQRWARLLGEAFVGNDGAAPRLERGELLAWIERMQHRWDDEFRSAVLDEIEEASMRQGSFATFLGCLIEGLHTTRPTWRAAALGDVVLFHVSDGRVTMFPDLGPDGFGINPEGIFTQPRMAPRMARGLDMTSAVPLAVGDTLHIASDALAEWLSAGYVRDQWAFLADLDDEALFEHVVRTERAAGRLKNDDVTLLNITVTAGDPTEFSVSGR